MDRPELRKALRKMRFVPLIDFGGALSEEGIKQIEALLPDEEEQAEVVGRLIGLGWTPPEELMMKLDAERERIYDYLMRKYMNSGAGVSRSYSRTATYQVVKDLMLDLALKSNPSKKEEK